MAHRIPLRELLARLPRFELSFTSVCPLCSVAADNGALCRDCLSELTQQRRQGLRCHCCALQLTAQGQCLDCVARKPAYERVYAAFDFLAPADLLLHQYKSQRRLSLVRVLSKALHAEIRHQESPLARDLWVLSVPSRRSALQKRGFNPAGELARDLAKRLGRLYKAGHLYGEQQATTQAQKHRSRQSRLAAGFEGWACKPIHAGTHVLVVDDVLTTGSTLHHASLLCLAAGAASVQVAVAARTPWRELSITA